MAPAPGQIHDWRQAWSPTVFFSLVTGQQEWQSHLHKIVKAFAAQTTGVEG
jgi:hypothetical protein